MNRIRNILLAVASVVVMSASAQKSITNAVYWLDADYSSPRPTATAIDISALHPGAHSYHMRVQDSEGMWSAVMTKYFIIPRPAPEASATTITAREYWLDGKYSARVTLTPSPATIDIGSLSRGLHMFSTRVRDDKGHWSPVMNKYFIILVNPVDTVSPGEQSQATIDRCRYWFNDSVQNAQIATLEAVAGIIDLDISHLGQGEHTLYWQVRNSNQAWSKVYSETFNITIAEYLLGDVNNDGRVDVSDINIIINVMLGKDQASNYGHRCYVTDDQTVDVSDVNAVINIMLGKY